MSKDFYVQRKRKINISFVRKPIPLGHSTIAVVGPAIISVGIVITLTSPDVFNPQLSTVKTFAGITTKDRAVRYFTKIKKQLLKCPFPPKSKTKWRNKVIIDNYTHCAVK